MTEDEIEKIRKSDPANLGYYIEQDKFWTELERQGPEAVQKVVNMQLKRMYDACGCSTCREKSRRLGR